MFIIGITGGTGAGKTSALRVLERLGALVLDCDAIYHKLLEDSAELKSELGDRFGGVLRAGEIDRKRLGEIVFSDPAALMDLNGITHKYVDGELESSLALWKRQGGAVAAVDAIALIESGLGGRCDAVVGVAAPEDKRISRIMERDGLSREQAERRAGAQKPEVFFRENCEYLLENIYDTAEEFEEKCMEFFEKLLGGRTNA